MMETEIGVDEVRSRSMGICKAVVGSVAASEIVNGAGKINGAM